MFKTARISYLSIGVIVILTVALTFLYLIQRQEIYANIKTNNQQLVEKEVLYYERISREWTNILTFLTKNDQFRRYMSLLIKGENTSKAKSELEKVFNRVGARHFEQILYIRYIDAKGMEQVVSKNAKTSDQYRNLSDTAFFKQGILARTGEVSRASLEKWKGNAYIHRSLPVVVKKKRLGILSITVDIKKMLQRYDYLLSAKVADDIALINRQGRLLYHFGSDTFDKNEAELVFGVVKQSATNSPIMEYQQNIWSYVNNQPYGFTILFLSKGDNIIKMLNSEYTKLAIVLFLGNFALVFLIFKSTKKIHRQQISDDQNKIIVTQRSNNFASVSDEIRRPINTLLGSLVTLSETTLNKKQKNYMDLAKKSADYLLALVNEFQDYSKITRGKFELEKIEFDLRATVHDIAELMSAQAYDKGLEVSCLVSADVPIRVFGDVTRLRQVLINLVSYAVHYTDNGEVSLCISADFYNQETRYINIDISDTGGLTDQETMVQQFAMFTDIDIESEDNYSGEGLGLALSKQLIELMAGEITMQENSLGGNTFRIRLPLPVVDEVKKPIVKDNLEGKRILIVGEIENNRNALSQAFASWGMSGAAMEEFDRVANVLRDAMMSNNRFDVCLLDVSLTSSSEKAFDVAKQIRLELGVDDLVLVTLTAQGVPGDARRARELGIQAYLTKPVSREHMHTAIIDIFNTDLSKEPTFVTKHSLKEGKQQNKHRILLADKDTPEGKLLLKEFNLSGVHMDIANNGEKVELAIKNSIYDAVFINVTLSGLNVFNFVQDLRKDESNFNAQLNQNITTMVHMPIIAILESADEKLIEKCKKSGFTDVIHHPFEKLDLNALIKE